MKLSLTTNNWNCLPAAVSTVLFPSAGVKLAEFYIGHDGSELVREADGSQQHRGFHPQEMIELALLFEHSVTQIDMYPTALASWDDKNDPVVFDTILGEDHEDRFNRHLKESYGWIDCRTRHGTGHALAYEYSTIGDPSSGMIFNYKSKPDAEVRGFYLVSLFRLDSIGDRL